MSSAWTLAHHAGPVRLGSLAGRLRYDDATFDDPDPRVQALFGLSTDNLAAEPPDEADAAR